MIDNLNIEPGITTLLAAWEKAHHCTVSVSKFDQVKLNAALAAGTPPDLVRTTGASEMPNIIARGLALNLDKYFATSTAFKAADLDPVIGVYKFNGKAQGTGSIYGIPSDYSQDNMLWYRKSLLDAAKITQPSSTTPISYDELLTIGKAVTKRQSGKTTVFGMDPTWNFVNQAHLMQMIAQQGGSLWSSDFTAADFTTPEARKALQWYVDWGTARTGIGPLDPESSWEGPLYDANRVSVVTYGYWFNAEIIGPDAGSNGTKLQEDSGFAPAPQMGSTRVDACFTGSGAWIPAKAPNPSLAFKFLEFWRGAGSQAAINHFKAGGGLPLCKSLRQYLPQTTPVDKVIYNTAIGNLANFSVLRFSPYASGAAMEAAITTNIEPVMKGQTSLAAAITTLQSAVNAIITTGKAELGA
jgi:multiple sugar transport system substrate-binding protein